MPRTLTVALVLLGAACRREAPPPSRQATTVGTASDALGVAPAPQDTGFAGTTAPIHRSRQARQGVPAALLRGIAADSSPGYDRIVFQFAGDSVPGYHVEYTTAPVRRCGSGDPVSVAGRRQLLVRFEPAQAHDDQGHPLPPERERAPGFAAVKEMKLVCDFEGQVEWVLGVATAAPYRVSELAGPARLVLDVRHGR